MLCHVVIGFKRVLYPHTAERLAASLFGVLVDFCLVGFVSTVTADNATTNPVMVSKLNELVEAEISRMLMDNEIGVEDFESRRCDIAMLRCLAHVIQLGVKEGLKEAPAIDVSIGLFRDLVKVIHDSPKLREVRPLYTLIRHNIDAIFILGMSANFQGVRHT